MRRGSSSHQIADPPPNRSAARLPAAARKRAAFLLQIKVHSAIGVLNSRYRKTTLSMGRVLVIEEDPEVRKILLEMLKRCGHDAGIAGDCVNPEVPQECDLRCCDGYAAPDLAVIAAITGRPCSGIEAALMILANWPTTKVLLISASPIQAWPASDQSRLRDLPIHSYAFLPKPFTVSDLREAVDHLIG